MRRVRTLYHVTLYTPADLEVDPEGIRGRDRCFTTLRKALRQGFNPEQVRLRNELRIDHFPCEKVEIRIAWVVTFEDREGPYVLGRDYALRPEWFLQEHWSYGYQQPRAYKLGQPKRPPRSYWKKGRIKR